MSAAPGEGSGLRSVPYRLAWRPGGARPGAHPALGAGDEAAFRRHVPLARRPDPRRLDLRASFRDPSGTLLVREGERRGAVAVVAVVDLSGSMGFAGRAARMDLVTNLCVLLAESAYRMGDSFGLFGCGGTVRDDVTLPVRRARGREAELRAALAAAAPGGDSAAGLAAAHAGLPRRRSLVALISDFRFPLGETAAVLDTLWRHDVLPVVVGDGGEAADLPAWGLLELRDLETGRRRLVAMRPRLRAAWRRAERERAAALDALFSARGRPPFHLADRLDPERLAEQLMAA